jgi:hypothetical protein
VIQQGARFSRRQISGASVTNRCCQRQTTILLSVVWRKGASTARSDAEKTALLPPLLPVLDEYFVARRCQLFAILLEAGQNSKVALVDYLTTVARDITTTRFLLLLSAAMLSNDASRKT